MARFGMLAGFFLLGMSLPQMLSLLHRAGALGGFLYWGSAVVFTLFLLFAIAYPGAFCGMFGTSPAVFKMSAIALMVCGIIGLVWGWF